MPLRTRCHERMMNRRRCKTVQDGRNGSAHGSRPQAWRRGHGHLPYPHCRPSAEVVGLTDGPSADAILAALPDAVYVVDTDRRITYWNAAAERMTGWSAADVMGKRCRDGILNHVDDRGRSLCGRRCPLLRTMRDGSPARARPFLHDRGGRRLPVVVSAAPLYDAAGAIAGAVEAFHDDSHFRDLAQDFAHAERAARTDQLTGLGNRRLLDAALEQAAEGRAPWAALFVDVDRFKSVNDRFGHETGDAVLRKVAGALRRCCR